METWRFGNWRIYSQGNIETGNCRDKEISRQGNIETGKYGDREIWKQ